MARLGLDGDPAQFGEGIDPGPASEAAVARSLDPAEWHLRFVVHGRAVDVTDARLNLPCDLEAAGCIAGEDRGGQAIFGVVGELDRMRLVAGSDDSDHGSE